MSPPLNRFAGVVVADEAHRHLHAALVDRVLDVERERTSPNRRTGAAGVAATAASCASGSTAAGTSSGSLTTEPTDGATKSTSRAAVRPRLPPAEDRHPPAATPELPRDPKQRPNGEIGRSSTGPTGSVTHATGPPTRTKIVVENARRHARRGPSFGHRRALRRARKNTPVITTIANARSPQRPAPRTSQLRMMSRRTARPKSKIASTHRTTTGQPLSPSSQFSSDTEAS